VYRNVAGQHAYVFATDDNGDPATGEAGNITATIYLDAGAGAATNDLNPTEMSGGVYYFNLTQAETDADEIVVVPVCSTAGVSMAPITIYTTWTQAVMQAALNAALAAYGVAVPADLAVTIRADG